MPIPMVELAPNAAPAPATSASPDVLLDFAACAGFEEACRLSLTFLHERLGLGLWMVTRTQGDDWIVLDADDTTYGIGAGDVLRWSDSFCSRMVQGEGPFIAPDARLVSAYVNAPVAQQLEINAYVGAPLCAPDGSLFGTLCAIDPEPQSQEIERELPLVRLISTLLGTVLAAELRAHEQHRRAEREQLAANQDALTRVGTRRYWDSIVAAEEVRSKAVGAPLAVVAIDLDGLKRVNDVEGHHAGDLMLSRAARSIVRAVRSDDVVARVGGDEFAVLATNCPDVQAERMAARIRVALELEGIAASVGYAMRSPSSTIDVAWREADARMYAEKRAPRVACASRIA